MPRRIADQLTPSMVVAVIALVAASSGVGYAAARIGSAQIADGSIQSVDLKDGTIATKDLNAAAVRSLRGARGAAGEDGRDGVNGRDGLNGRDGNNGTNGVDGDDGAPGITSVIAERKANVQTGLTTGPDANKLVVFSRALPAGAYSAQLKAEITNPGANQGVCVLTIGATEIDRTGFTPDAGSTGYVPLVTSLAGFTIASSQTLRWVCEIDSVAQPKARRSTMIVTKVGAVDGTSDV